MRAEICSAYREINVFVGTENKKRLGIEIGDQRMTEAYSAYYKVSCFDAREERRGRVDNLGKVEADYEG